MNAGYVVESLGSNHDRAAFVCGIAALDDYLKHRASQKVKRDVARVFVLSQQHSAPMLGYYTLSVTSITPDGLPSEVVKRLPRYPSLPALLIGRLAVDQRYQGQGKGRRLLLSALRRSLNLRAELGFIAVIVEAKDDAARTFYERYDFHRFVDNPYRLYIPMGMIAQIFPV